MGVFPHLESNGHPKFGRENVVSFFLFHNGLSSSKIRIIPLTLSQECCGAQEFSKVLHKFPAEFYTGSISQAINPWASIICLQLSERLCLASPSGYYEVEGVFNPMRGQNSR